MLRHRFQFRLRTLFVVMTLVAVGCAWFSARIAAKQRERAAVKTLTENGWDVVYDYQLIANGDYDLTREPTAPDWLRKLLGDNFFGDPVRLSSEIANDSQLDEFKEALRQVPTVKSVEVCGGEWLADTGLAIITEFTELESLDIKAGSGATDALIPKLKSLTKLKRLRLGSTHVSERSLRELKTALPSCKIADLGDDDEPSQ